MNQCQVTLADGDPAAGAPRKEKDQGQDGRSWQTGRPQTRKGRLRAESTEGTAHSFLAHTRVPRHRSREVCVRQGVVSSCSFPRVTKAAEAPSGRQMNLQWRSPTTQE